jgi:ATP-dependent helicase/nuclease subunit A
MLWKTPSGESPPAIAALRAQKHQREAEENLRLLYVALTRARCWLIVAGHGKAVKDGAWHMILAKGMAKLETAPTPHGLRHQTGAWPDASKQAQAHGTADPAPEDWMFLQTEHPAKTDPVLPPSDLGGAKALAGALGEDTEAAKARGTALHLLLQHLPDHPPSQWPQVAAGVLGDGFPDLFDQAKALLTNPDLHHIFTIGLSEVTLTAPWGDQHLLGTIDRLIVQPDHVLAVDFKSNRTVPATAETVPEGILRQMGAYQLMLEQLYTQPIHLAILWTETASLMRLDPDILRAALGRATTDGVTNP